MGIVIGMIGNYITKLINKAKMFDSVTKTRSIESHFEQYQKKIITSCNMSVCRSVIGLSY